MARMEQAVLICSAEQSESGGAFPSCQTTCDSSHGAEGAGATRFLLVWWGGRADRNRTR